MGKSAIIGWPKRPWTGYVATVCGALFSAFAFAGSAQSADFYPGYGGYPGYGYPGYGPAGYHEGNGYHPHCFQCGCGPCGCIHRCGGCGSPCYPRIHRSSVIERHWVEREYFERRSPGPCCRPYAYNTRPYYSDSAYPDYFGGLGWPRPHLGWGGIAAPIGYDDDGPPRPPVGIPSYYDAGYAE